MVVNELLDDNSFNQEKVFDKEEYSTLIINREGFTNAQNAAANVVEALFDNTNTRRENEELFKKLKATNAAKILVNAIKHTSQNNQKTILTAACWESGLDFSDHFYFFAELACNADFNIAMEALTVVQNCEGTISKETLNKTIQYTLTCKDGNAAFLEDLVLNITQRLEKYE